MGTSSTSLPAVASVTGLVSLIQVSSALGRSSCSETRNREVQSLHQLAAFGPPDVLFAVVAHVSKCRSAEPPLKSFPVSLDQDVPWRPSRSIACGGSSAPGI
jgi:hypothetical protein